MAVSAINRMGLVFLGIISVMLALSFPLRCFPSAAEVAAADTTAGCALGLALAMITRSRRPVAIYFWLLIACLTMLPLISPWPRGDSLDITLWRRAPDIFYNYFDFLRGGVYLLAMPYPFARFGQHSPDPLPEAHPNPPEST